MSSIKNFFKNTTARVVAIMTVVTIIVVVVTYNWLIEFSSFTLGLAKGVLGILIFLVFDQFAMPSIDTIEELKKGNIAYALYLLGICVVVGAAIINS